MELVALNNWNWARKIQNSTRADKVWKQQRTAFCNFRFLWVLQLKNSRIFHRDKTLILERRHHGGPRSGLQNVSYLRIRFNRSAWFSKILTWPGPICGRSWIPPHRMAYTNWWSCGDRLASKIAQTEFKQWRNSSRLDSTTWSPRRRRTWTPS